MPVLGVRMHGVTLAFETDHEPLLDYARRHLHGLIVDDTSVPHLRVRCFWSQGEWDETANPFATHEPLNVIGKRMLGNAHELIWLNTLRMKGLQLRFRRAHEQWHFEVAYRFHPKKEKLESLPEYEHKKYFSLLSYLVYHPLFWYLENFRGWSVLHASALAHEKGAIMIGGLGGVGKTTTCVALLQRPGFALMAENLVFTDGEFVYPCYEPIRLDENSLKILGADLKGLTPMIFPEGLKDKTMFHPPVTKSAEQAQAAALFLPQFAPQRYVKKITAELAAEKMLAMNRLTRELDDYYWYASALEMHWPRPNHAAQRAEIMRRFAARTRCFELGIDRGAGVEAVVKDILHVLARASD